MFYEKVLHVQLQLDTTETVTHCWLHQDIFFYIQIIDSRERNEDIC